MTAPDDEPPDPYYAYKPSLVGAACEFTLRSDGLHWQIGARNGRVRYERIRAVRLSYRPVTMQSRRFVTEIWSTDNPKMQIVSVSWRSVLEQTRQDSDYAAFVAELHRRLAAVGSTAKFTTGLPVPTYWLGVAVFASVLVTMAVLIVRALMLAQWGAAGVVGVIFLIFAYQIGNYFRLNRPERYRPDAIPPAILPKG